MLALQKHRLVYDLGGTSGQQANSHIQINRPREVFVEGSHLFIGRMSHERSILKEKQVLKRMTQDAALAKGRPITCIRLDPVTTRGGRRKPAMWAPDHIGIAAV
jgi:hypothetical protein